MKKLTGKLHYSTTPQDSLIRLADKLVSATGDLVKAAKTEEDLRIGFEKILRSYTWEKLGGYTAFHHKGGISYYSTLGLGDR